MCATVTTTTAIAVMLTTVLMAATVTAIVVVAMTIMTTTTTTTVMVAAGKEQKRNASGALINRLSNQPSHDKTTKQSYDRKAQVMTGVINLVSKRNKEKDKIKSDMLDLLRALIKCVEANEVESLCLVYLTSNEIAYEFATHNTSLEVLGMLQLAAARLGTQ